MRILWTCPLIEWPRKNLWNPAIVKTSVENGNFPCRWSVDVRNKLVAGVAEVTAAQVVAIQADPQIKMELADVDTRQWDGKPLASLHAELDDEIQVRGRQ